MLATRLANDSAVGRDRLVRGQRTGIVHRHKLLPGRPMARWLGTLGKFRYRTKTRIAIG